MQKKKYIFYILKKKKNLNELNTKNGSFNLVIFLKTQKIKSKLKKKKHLNNITNENLKRKAKIDCLNDEYTKT